MRVAKNGTEHTHPDYVDAIRNKEDPGSLMVRFAPDGIALTTKRTIYWEAKSGNNLERFAYETYMNYYAMGVAVMVFVRRNDGCVYWQWVQCIGFVPSCDVIGRHLPDRRHPLDEDDWICPRMGHGYAGSGSGTAYREIDFSSLNQVEDWHVRGN